MNQEYWDNLCNRLETMSDDKFTDLVVQLEMEPDIFAIEEVANEISMESMD